MRRKCTCFCASFDHKLASTSKNTAAPLDHIYEENPLSHCLSEKVNIRQGALQPQMGMGPIQWLTVNRTQSILGFVEERFLRTSTYGDLLVNPTIPLNNIHCKPCRERNISTRKPSDATCARRGERGRRESMQHDPCHAWHSTPDNIYFER